MKTINEIMQYWSSRGNFNVELYLAYLRTKNETR
jgi:hypothetical protein